MMILSSTEKYEHNEMPTSYSRGCISSNLCEDTRRLLFLLGGDSIHNVMIYLKCGRNSAWFVKNSASSVRLNVMSLLLGLFTLIFY